MDCSALKRLAWALPLLATAAPAAALSNSPGDACNFGPTHHSHLVLPLAVDAEACSQPDATFLLSHGATWFCPHTFDVKLLGSIKEDDARKTLCDTHFDALAAGQSSKVVLRPTLPAGGLKDLAEGRMASWVSPVMYHIHNFGKNNAAGPDAGWNTTTVRSTNTTLDVIRVLYGRQLDVQPRPAQLTYLAHNGQQKAGAVLSHYMSTSGSSGFDHILKVDLTHPGTDTPVVLRDTWPTFLTVPAHADAHDERLRPNLTYAADLHVYDDHGMPAVVSVQAHVTLDYYYGTSDGFAGFGTMCPSDQEPASPTTCM